MLLAILTELAFITHQQLCFYLKKKSQWVPILNCTSVYSIIRFKCSSNRLYNRNLWIFQWKIFQRCLIFFLLNIISSKTSDIYEYHLEFIDLRFSKDTAGKKKGYHLFGSATRITFWRICLTLKYSYPSIQVSYIFVHLF